MNFLGKKGQGAFEYVLILAGVLLIVVLAIVILRGGLTSGAGKDISASNCKQALAKLSACYVQPSGAWKVNGVVPTLPDACIAYNVQFGLLAGGSYNMSDCGAAP